MAMENMRGCGSDTCLPGASNSLQTLTSVLSAAGDSLCFLSVAVAQLYHALYTYKWLFAQLIMGPLIALKWLQVTFLTTFYITKIGHSIC